MGSKEPTRVIQRFTMYEKDGGWATVATLFIDPAGFTPEHFTDAMRVIASSIAEQFSCECKIEQDLPQTEETLLVSILEQLAK